MGDATESLFPAPNYNTPVKDLEYKDLLTNTFTQASHDRGIKTRLTIKLDRLIVLSKSSLLVWFLHVSLIVIIKGRSPVEVSLIVIIKQV